MNFDLPVLAPSILASDFTRLGEQIKECLESGTHWIHCDIMDGHFVPNISFGPGIVKSVRQTAPNAFIDVHLMIEKPDLFIEDFADSGADLISVHYEACPHLHRTLQNIRLHGCMAGVVINPATPVDFLRPILPDVDLALIMTVNPGFGGQSFINSSFEKVRQLAEVRALLGTHFLIQVDGGVGPDNIQKLVQHGTDILVAGSSVFKTDNIGKRIDELTKKAKAGAGKIV
ncbi:MAG: ribulose-phosphate 3-epimerase [Balneolaceae bacterium]|nr:MAG: ribulose-phosphate 3-epimerase [Balneolaceae bacterium]